MIHGVVDRRQQLIDLDEPVRITDMEMCTDHLGGPHATMWIPVF